MKWPTTLAFCVWPLTILIVREHTIDSWQGCVAAHVAMGLTVSAVVSYLFMAPEQDTIGNRLYAAIFWPVWVMWSPALGALWLLAELQDFLDPVDDKGA